MKEINYLLRYMHETFALLPLREELEMRFPHAKGCMANSQLTAQSELVAMNSADSRVGSIGVRSYFLRCDDCRVKREYRVT